MHILGTGCMIFVTMLLAGCAGVLDPELQRAKASRQPVFISNVMASAPSERGMIDVQLQLFNTSASTYKYVDISLIAYNRVGDVITRSGDLSPTVKLRFTGPLRPRRTPGTLTWPEVWRFQQVSCLAVSRIEITQTNGQLVAIDGALLKRVLASDTSKGCATG